MKWLKNILGIGEKKNLTIEEKIDEAKGRLSGFDLVSEILRIEERAGLLREGSEDWYYRLVDLCAEHKADFTIPCSEGGPC